MFSLEIELGVKVRVANPMLISVMIYSKIYVNIQTTQSFSRQNVDKRNEVHTQRKYTDKEEKEEEVRTFSALSFTMSLYPISREPISTNFSNSFIHYRLKYQYNYLFKLTLT